MHVVDAILWAGAAYLGVGAAFALAFVTRGVGRVDPVAAHAGAGFRLIIAPGCMLLWPVMALMWRRATRPGGAP